MTHPVSPLAPASFPALPVIGGVRFAAVAAGVRYQGRTDVMLAELAPGTVMAGTFTRSATRSAAVLDCQAKIGLAGTGGAAILVNSGNSNAFTGRNGRDAVARITGAVAAELGVDETRVFTSSTGVIGEPLPWDRITAVLGGLHAALDAGGMGAAAKAIMTTDTFPKGATVTVDVGGRPVRIAGMAKGSGMIAPDMATMLVYLFTDAVIGQADLQVLVSGACDRTFNCISVDSDTSTSDTLLMAATGASGVDVTGHAGFAAALHGVMLDLPSRLCATAKGRPSSSRCR
jgi:glutamate N-acetyltransferase / amino-acid N-acetyltransferase